MKEIFNLAFFYLKSMAMCLSGFCFALYPLGKIDEYTVLYCFLFGVFLFMVEFILNRKA